MSESKSHSTSNTHFNILSLQSKSYHLQIQVQQVQSYPYQALTFRDVFIGRHQILLAALIRLRSSSCTGLSSPTGGHYQIFLAALIRMCSSTSTAPSVSTGGYHQILLLHKLVWVCTSECHRSTGVNHISLLAYQIILFEFEEYPKSYFFSFYFIF